MHDIAFYLPNLTLAFGAFLLGMMSPGPNVLSIMGTSMSLGRKPGCALAFGIATGSVAWALLTVAGLSMLLATYVARDRRPRARRANSGPAWPLPPRLGDPDDQPKGGVELDCGRLAGIARLRSLVGRCDSRSGNGRAAVVAALALCRCLLDEGHGAAIR